MDLTIVPPAKKKVRGFALKKRKDKGSKRDANFQGQQKCGNCK